MKPPDEGGRRRTKEEEDDVQRNLMEDLEEVYDIRATAAYILRHGYTRVALQFPDSLLKVSVSVSSALRHELKKQSEQCDSVKLYILADTTFGSCCGDEIAAAHVNAECIIHYGHTCLTQSWRLPIRHVFGRCMIDVEDCVYHLVEYGSKCRQTILVLFDLRFAHAIEDLRKRLREVQSMKNVHVVDVPDKERNPLDKLLDETNEAGRDLHQLELAQKHENLKENKDQPHTRYSCGGFSWVLPADCKMDDVVIIWIGHENPALTNIMLSFNACTVVLYDPDKKCLIYDVTNQSKFLMRRYYLIERAKDANIVGIVVGTLGVAGHREMVQLLRTLVKESGKKSYTLSIGKPNPAKLANFPECDIFVLVSCPQTALLDSKTFMVPVITPFEAVIAWRRGCEWTGAYSLDFRSIIRWYNSRKDRPQEKEEARFSFIKGSYIEEEFDEEAGDKNAEHQLKALSPSNQAEDKLQLQEKRCLGVIAKVEARSGAEYFLSRSFQGLDVSSTTKATVGHVIGRKGRASGYMDEPGEH